MIILTPTGDVNQDTRNLQQAVAQHQQVVLDCQSGVHQSYMINDTITLDRSGQRLVGVNPWSTCVVWQGDPQKSVFEIKGAQYVSVSNMHIMSEDWQSPKNTSATWAIKIGMNGAIPSSYSEVNNVWIHGVKNGVQIDGGVEHRLTRLQLRALTGTKGVWLKGSAQQKLYRCIMSDIVADCGEYNNTQMDWITMDSFAYSLRIDNAALMNGRRGVVMTDSAQTGSSYPTWILANDLETDHTTESGVWLEAGEGFYAGESWLGSSIRGDGLTTCAAWRGDLGISNSRLFGNHAHGINLMAGKGATVVGTTVGDNGAGTAGAAEAYGILVGDATTATTIGNCHLGDAVGVVGNNQAYGLKIKSSALDVTYKGNICTGNVKGKVSDERSFWTRWFS